MMMRNCNIRLAALLLLLPSSPTLAVSQEDNAGESAFRVPLEEAEEYKSSTNSESSNARYVVKFKRGSKAYSERFEDAADQYYNVTSLMVDVNHSPKSKKGALNLPHKYGNRDRRNSPRSSKKGNMAERGKVNRKHHSLLTFGRFLPRDNVEIIYLSDEDVKIYEEMDDVEYVELGKDKYTLLIHSTLLVLPQNKHFH